MACLPITLEGDNLGKRHKHLNSLVNEAFKHNVPFDSVKDISERSAIDRLFKIDLANKYKNVDYILHTLKDDDMLYVSRAMKCIWLVSDNNNMNVINPVYLEQNLYPEMRTNAKNKMKHWIQLHLRSETRSKEFYDYYKNEELDFALKFLPKCPIDCFLEEMEVIPTHKIKPQLLKLLCERSTKAAEIYFKKLKITGDSDKGYIAKMQILLKPDPETYFYVIENFFLNDCKRLNKKATHYIMKNYKNKFDAKPELYTARVLHLTEIAKFFNTDEIQKIIIKMAKAKYLKTEEYFEERFVFDYEFAKPLVKAIALKERSNFCTKIFTVKQFGEPVDEPPYLIPSKPKTENKEDKENYFHFDKDNDYDKALNGPPPWSRCCARGRGGGFFKFPTELDKLFDEYRFKSFKKTLAELRKRIPKESKMEMRQNMMLVLVSKTGGRTESVNALMKYLLGKHSNETINMRAAIVRSFVKRAFAWRWPEDNWKLLLKFGQGLGLDGEPSEVECREGLHVVILRHIILNNECPSAVWKMFLNNFTSLNDYKLDSSERRILHERLPALLLLAMKNEQGNPETSLKRLTEVCDALDAYKLKIETYPGVIEAIAEFAQNNNSLAKPLLLRIFKAGIGRKTLFKQNFEIIQTDASYINALRHDTTLLSEEKFKTLLANIKDLCHNQYFRKLALYFGEDEGLATRHMKILQRKGCEEPHIKLVRPMALLTGAHNIPWPVLDAPSDEIQLQKYRQMMSSLQKNSHLARGKVPLSLDTKDANLSALANWIQACSLNALQSKLEVWMAVPRHARLVLALRAPKMPGLISKTVPHAARRRPMRTLRITLRILRRNPQVFLPQDFEVLKSLIYTINLKGCKFESYCVLARLNSIPKTFRAEYTLSLYQNLMKLGFGPDYKCTSQPYYRIAVPLIMCMRNHINELDPDIIEIILKEFLEKEFTLKSIDQFGKHNERDYCWAYNDYRDYLNQFMKLTARFLITSKTEENMKSRLLNIYEPYEQRLKEMWHNENVHDNSQFGFGYFENFLNGVLFTKVFVNEADFSAPLYDKLCQFADEVAPLTENFALNYRIRFIQLLRQAVKQSVSVRPELFKNGIVEGKEALNSVLFVFGKVAAHDAEKLIPMYFPSIRVFYTNALQMFLMAHSLHMVDYNESVILGLLNDTSKINGVIIGLSLYHSQFNRSRFNILDELVNDLITNAKSDEIKFYRESSESSSNYRALKTFHFQ